MNTSKRLISLMTIVVLLASVFTVAFPAGAYEDLIYDKNIASGDRRVFDFAELLTDDEITDLESCIDKTASKVKLDIVVVTVNSTSGKSDTAYADDFFDYNGFGYGEDFDGVILLINMRSRTTWISTCGMAVKYLTDAMIDKINDDVTDGLKTGDYYGGIKAFVDDVDDYVGSSFKLFGLVYRPFTLIICLIIAVVIAFVYYKAVVKSYKFNGKTQPYAYKEKSRLNLTNKSDVLVDTRVVTTRIQSSGGSSGGGSSTHRSSSGRSHGGGGGRF